MSDTADIRESIRDRLMGATDAELETIARRTIHFVMAEIHRRGRSLVLRSEEFAEPMPGAAE